MQAKICKWVVQSTMILMEKFEDSVKMKITDDISHIQIQSIMQQAGAQKEETVPFHFKSELDKIIKEASY